MVKLSNNISQTKYVHSNMCAAWVVSQAWLSLQRVCPTRLQPGHLHVGSLWFIAYWYLPPPLVLFPNLFFHTPSSLTHTPSPVYSHASLHTHFVITLNYVVELAPPSPSRSNYSHSYLHENITQWLRRRLVLFFAPRTSKKVCFGERREDERREKWGGWTERQVVLENLTSGKLVEMKNCTLLVMGDGMLPSIGYTLIYMG